MTKKQQKQQKLSKSRADKIQPTDPKIFERDTFDMDEKGKKLYKKMVKIYDKLCKDDISFSLVFSSPTEHKPSHFFRICEPSEQERFRKASYSVFSQMFCFLEWNGFIQHLEANKVLTLHKRIFPLQDKTEKDKV